MSERGLNRSREGYVVRDDEEAVGALEIMEE